MNKYCDQEDCTHPTPHQHKSSIPLLKGCRHSAEIDNTLILLTFRIEDWLRFTDLAPNQRVNTPVLYICCKICFTTLDLWHKDCPIDGEGG